MSIVWDREYPGGQMAGRVLYYDDSDNYYLQVTADEIRGVSLGVVCRAGKYDEKDGNSWI
ncbi:hypothetical protein [Paenibacillus sp. S150]|uniref:hypothetical protein n=1 Tax=Paenibacillus sp. S150 TaxID=2749826 RepID=UPI001C596958|nr:hypothetical protein [Paenibacillus sp. S150]MBW4080327.1 hypothetical protein [Paenibacillus sp. S150]